MCLMHVVDYIANGNGLVQQNSWLACFIAQVGILFAKDPLG